MAPHLSLDQMTSAGGLRPLVAERDHVTKFPGGVHVHARIFFDQIEEDGLAKLGGSLVHDRNSTPPRALKIERKLTAHCRLTVSDCARSYIRLIAAITASVAASLIPECIGSCTHSAAAASVTGRCVPIDWYGASKCDAMTPRRVGMPSAW